MNNSSTHVFKTLAFSVSAAFAAAGAGSAWAAGPKAAAAGVAVSADSAQAQVWSASSGTVGVRWNRELASDLGMALGAASGRFAQLSG